MRRLISCLFPLVLVITAIASHALAQADAQKAYQEAKAAYQAGNFVEARNKALQASQTDPQNAEVLLLLGQAHYQLGELDEAIAAWQRTLKLAPEEPYAERMLDVLRAERVEVDARIELVEALARERLFEAATRECHGLLAEEAITGAQRARIMLMQADMHLRQGKPIPGSREMLERLRVLYPDEADTVGLSLLSGRIKLRGGGGSTAEGVAELKAIVADHRGTPAAATAQYELIAFDRQDGADTAWAEAMAQWIADHPDHPLAYDARRELIAGYLEVTRRSGKPAQDADLSPTDAKALALAAELFTAGLRVEEASQLHDQLGKHVQAHYADNRAHQAAVKAMETLLAASLPATSRLPVLRALAHHKTSVLTGQLDEEARAGKLPQGVARGELPQAVAGVLAIYDVIDKEHPAQPTWPDRVQLAATLRGYAPKVLPLAEFKGLKGPDAWALDVAFPVIKSNAHTDAVQSAIELVKAVVQERTQVPKPGSQELAVDISTELALAVSPSHTGWSGVMDGHARLLDTQARALFDENLKKGDNEENAKLSDLQQQLLAALQKHVGREAAHAPAALELLAAHLKPWVEHGHWTVAEEAYTAVEQALPERERREAALAVVSLWLQRVDREHDRLRAVGLTVPRRLDPTHLKVLKRCYTLQGEVDEEPAELKRIRDVVDRLVGRYVGLEYFEIAEQAVQVKADEPARPADEYAELQLVRLKDGQARRELDLFLKQYNASERITLTPGFKEVIEAYKKFISDRPASPLALQATDGIFGIGQLYQSHGAHQLAGDVYRDFGEFAASVDVLSVSAPGTASTLQRARSGQPVQCGTCGRILFIS